MALETTAFLEATFPTFDAVSTASFGAISATLLRRRPQADAPPSPGPSMQEIFYIASHSDLESIPSEAVEAYARFHRSYVTHRRKQRWPHRYALVYDYREMAPPADVPAFLARAATIVRMHMSCGDAYLTWLHAVAVLVSSESAARVCEQVLALAPSRPAQPVLISQDPSTVHERLLSAR